MKLRYLITLVLCSISVFAQKVDYRTLRFGKESRINLFDNGSYTIMAGNWELASGIWTQVEDSIFLTSRYRKGIIDSATLDFRRSGNSRDVSINIKSNHEMVGIASYDMNHEFIGMIKYPFHKSVCFDGRARYIKLFVGDAGTAFFTIHSTKFNMVDIFIDYPSNPSRYFFQHRNMYILSRDSLIPLNDEADHR